MSTRAPAEEVSAEDSLHCAEGGAGQGLCSPALPELGWLSHLVSVENLSGDCLLPPSGRYGRAGSGGGLGPHTSPAPPKSEATPASLPSVLEILAGPEARGGQPVHSLQVVLGGPSGRCGLCDQGFQGPQAVPSHQEVLCHLCSRDLPGGGKKKVNEQRAGRCTHCRQARCNCAQPSGPQVISPGALHRRPQSWKTCISEPRLARTWALDTKPPATIAQAVSRGQDENTDFQSWSIWLHLGDSGRPATEPDHQGATPPGCSVSWTDTVTLSTEPPPLAGDLPLPTLGFHGSTWDDINRDSLHPISDPAPEDLDQWIGNHGDHRTIQSSARRAPVAVTSKSWLLVGLKIGGHVGELRV